MDARYYLDAAEHKADVAVCALAALHLEEQSIKATRGRESDVSVGPRIE